MSAATMSRAQLQLRAEVLDYLWRRFPQHCILLTDPQTNKVIDLAIERARAHGFKTANEVASWATLMVYFGSYFDVDPLCPWAVSALGESISQPRGAAIEQLFAEMNEAVDPIIGPSAEYYRQALVWVAEQKLETFDNADPTDIEASISHCMNEAFPAKYASLETGQRHFLIAESLRKSHRFRLSEPAGPIIYSLLVLLLGAGIDRDPLHPWAAEVLRPDVNLDPPAKTKRLHERGISVLRRTLILSRFAVSN
jgi:hypothetical protein